MKKQSYLFFTATVISASVTTLAQNAIGFGGPTTKNSELITKNSLKGSGMMFTPNKGQIADMEGKLRPEILYKGDGGGSDVYLRKTGISYVTSNMGEVMSEIDKEVELRKFDQNFSQQQTEELKHQLEEKALIKIQRTDVDFEGGNPNPQTLTEEEVEGYTNYYYAHCPNGITNVKSYNRVVQKNIYTGIDVIYYGGKQNGLKYDIVVNPGADPKQIKLNYTGAQVKLEGSKLIVQSELGETVETLPKVYQNINGEIVDVKCEYKLEMVRGSKLNVRSEESQQSTISPNHYIVTFELTTYNHELPLIIDPWVTYYGGAYVEEIYGITADPSGNPVFTGWTMSANFPVSVGAFQVAYSGNATEDAFVAKMNPAGALLYSTYIGGTQSDFGWDVACDVAGNICVTGTTASANFPIGSSGANIIHQNVNGGTSAFIIKFNPVGARLWSTYYGGSGVNANYTQGRSVTTDGNNIIIFGSTNSTSSIATPGTIQPINIPYAGLANALYVAKFASNGVRLWGTYLLAATYAGGIDCDAAGNIFAAGSAWGRFATTAGAHQPAWGGGSGPDAFLCKLNSSGTTMLWSTYYGGRSTDEGGAVEIDNSGNAVLAGWTSSANAIASAGAWQPGFAGSDIFIAKFNTNGVRQWGTYLGSATQDFFGGLAVDNSNNIYVSGEWEDASNPKNYPVSACAYQPNRGGVEDDYIAKYDPNGKQLCFTYIGGSGEDEAAGEIGLSEGGGPMTIFQNFLYFTCLTNGGYPVTPGAFQTAYGGDSGASSNREAAISQLCINICEAKILALAYTANTTTACTNAPVKFTPSVNNACDTTGYRFHWVFSGGTPAVSDSVSPTVKFSGAGNYDVKLVVTTLCKKDSITKTNYITVNPCGGCTLSAQYTKGTANCSNCGCKEWIMVSATGGTKPYSYAWPDGYDKRYKNALCPGAYNVIVTDGNGCKTTVKVNAP